MPTCGLPISLCENRNRIGEIQNHFSDISILLKVCPILASFVLFVLDIVKYNARVIVHEDISRETIGILADFIYIYIYYMTSIKVYMHVLFSLVFPFILGVCFQMKVTFTLYLIRER